MEDGGWRMEDGGWRMEGRPDRSPLLSDDCDSAYVFDYVFGIVVDEGYTI